MLSKSQSSDMGSDLNDRDEAGMKVIADEISQIQNLIEKVEP